jgi:hypothetical protein
MYATLSLYFISPSLLLQQQLQVLSDHVCITAFGPSVNHLVANAGAWSISFFDEITNITAFTKMMVSQPSALLMCTEATFTNCDVNEFKQCRMVTFLACSYQGRELLGLCLPNQLRPATPQGQQRKAHRVFLHSGDGAYI